MTRHGRYLRSECLPYGSRLIVNLVYDPAEAMGINMITDASFAVARLISGRHGDLDFFFPSAFQADKKATFYGFQRGRGRSVTAEVTISSRVVDTLLGSSVDAIHAYHLNNVETAHLLGGHGFNMHIANGITALGLATGQDPAYVAESASGNLVVEKTADGLACSLSIPSLYVGTVGGGTGLPSARACLQMLGCTGKDSALKLAEIFAGTCLAGEISVLAAIASKGFAAAHNRLGRNRPGR
jgi:hydroxymethylglutaryl-CoA reductase (NADPH)